MRWPIIGLIGLGIFAAVCAALLVAFLGAGGKSSSPVLTGQEIVAFMVADRDLPAMSVVKQEMLKETKAQRSELPPGALANASQVVGRAVIKPMVAGQPFTRTSFVPEGTGPHLAAILQPGMRAVTVQVSEYAGLEGILYPGSVVDVLTSFKAEGNDATSTVLLEGVQVLAIENKLVTEKEDPEAVEQGAKAVVRSSPNRRQKVTLLVDPRQAQLLQLSMEHGFLSLALRNPLDQKASKTKPMLLSNGRMSDFDAGLNPSEGLFAKLPWPVQPPTPPEAPKPAPQPAAAPQWQVTIMRGSEVETKSFDLPRSSTAQIR